MEVSRYSPDESETWNDFVAQSVNGTFMFNRSFMDYHSNLIDVFDARFTDHSLLIWKDTRLVAILPANENDGKLISHQGLTFGGLLVQADLKTPYVIESIDAICEYLQEAGMESLEYKCIPYIYHTLPASADRYALFRADAELYRRDVSSAIPLSDGHKFPRRRRRELNKANDVGVTVKRTTDEVGGFWEVLSDNLEREHGVTPVHTVDEIRYLMERFPNNLKLFCAYEGGTMLAGAMMFESMETTRIQYLGVSEEGKAIGASEKILDHLVNQYYSERNISFLDFGISTEDDGQLLNEGLITFKESFDAHPFVHDFYRLKP